MTRKKKRKYLQDGIYKTKFLKVIGPKLDEADRRELEASKLPTHRKEIISDTFWTDDEKRILNMWRQFYAIYEHLTDINSTIKYIKLNGLKTFLKKNDLTENEYLRFIYENHQIRVYSTLDIITIIGDLIYPTGLKPRNLNWKTFSESPKISSRKCAKILIEFQLKLDYIREERNKLIHYGGYKTKSIESIEAVTFDKKFLKSNFLITRFKSRRLNEVKNLEREMKSNYRICLYYTKQFLDSTTKEISLLKVG